MLLQYDCRLRRLVCALLCVRARVREFSALSHAAPLVMPPCDTDFPDEVQRVASGLWAAMGFR